MKFEINKMQEVIKRSTNANFNDDQQTVTISGVGDFTGYLWGDDECFEGSAFYQYLTCDDGYLYQMYFQVPDEDAGDLSNVDYSQAYRAVKCELDDEFDFDGTFIFSHDAFAVDDLWAD